MNYERIYNEFISNRLSKQNIDGYSELHHIIPKSFGGTDESNNLIRLTASDHLFAHALLARIYKGKMIWALHRMLNCNKRYTNRNDRLHYNFMRSNLKISNETKDKMCRAQSGENNGFYKKSHSDKAKKKMSRSHKGKTLTKEHRDNISKVQGKKVYQFDLNKNFLNEYKSLKEAAEKLNLKSTHIGRVCKGKRKSTGGFIWSYSKVI